jgi:peptidoglycan/LPS O-acetylase OafA/YrhL
MLEAQARPDTSRGHIVALDGIRGLMLAAVLAHHADPAWLPGAPVALTVFFVLSGFLITSLLLRELETTGRVDLKAFWLRRARRLVPASVAAVVLVAVLVAAGALAPGGGLLGDAVASLTWSANWRFVAEGATYESLFADPSPFQHFWSLAVEEQVYLLLPVLSFALLGRSGRHRVRFGAVVLAGVAASTWAVIALHESGGGGGHAYYGTEARLAEPLVGVLLALAITRRDGIVGFVRRGAVAAVDVAGWAALAGLGVLLTTLSVEDGDLYRGGFLLAAILGAVIVLAATQRTTLAAALSLPVLVGIGAVSYATYLFHWPIFQWLLQDTTAAEDPQRAAGALVLTFVLALASTALLEDPIRRGRHRAATIFTAGWANASVTAVAVVVVATAIATSSGTATAEVDLGFAPTDAVPAPPVIAAPVDGAAPAPAPAPGEVARSAPGVAPVPGEQAAPAPGPAPIDADEQAILEGGGGEGRSGWEAGDVEDVPPAGEALRVAVIGDSLAHNLAVGLTTWAKEQGDVVVYDLSVSFCPLSRGGERRWYGDESFPVHEGCRWWDDPYSDRAEAFSLFRPDVVVDAAPFSELLDRRLPDWDEWRRPGDPEYHRWLLDEYSALFTSLRSIGGGATRFLSLNAPCADFSRTRGWRHMANADDRIEALDRAFYPLLVDTAQGDLFSQLCPEGEFSDDVYGIDDGRPDGAHLSDELAAELARRWLGPLVRETAATPSLLGPPGR